MVELPILNLPHFVYRTILDGIAYRIQIDWNTREEAWYLTLRNNDEEILVSNVRLVPSLSLLAHHPQQNLPPGAFLVMDTSAVFPATKGVITRDNLGTQFILMYVTQAELT